VAPTSFRRPLHSSCHLASLLRVFLTTELLLLNSLRSLPHFPRSFPFDHLWQPSTQTEKGTPPPATTATRSPSFLTFYQWRQPSTPPTRRGAKQGSDYRTRATSVSVLSIRGRKQQAPEGGGSSCAALPGLSARGAANSRGFGKADIPLVVLSSR